MSVVPPHVAVKRKAINEDASATKRQKAGGGNAVEFKQSAVPDEDELDSLARALQGLKDEVFHFSNPLPVSILVVQGGVGGDVGLALQRLENYFEDQLADTQRRVVELAEIIAERLLAQIPDDDQKLKEKLRNLTGRRRRPINTLGYVFRMAAHLPFADILYRRWRTSLSRKSWVEAKPGGRQPITKRRYA